MTLNETLQKTIDTDTITLTDFLPFEIFTKEIIDPEEPNDFFETYEVFLALLLSLTKDALEEEDYERLELIKTTKTSQEIRYYNNICYQMSQDLNDWFYFTNQYFDNTFQQLHSNATHK